MSKKVRLVLATATLLAALAAAADTSVTPRAAAEIAKYGQPYPGNRFLELRALYEPYLEAAGFPASEADRDIAYGPNEKQRLDVLKPQHPPDSPMPVVAFVHGGAFVLGDKGGDPIFDNVLNYFTRHGMLGVNLNYRLAPDHPYPAAGEDLAAAMDWIRKNAERYGGDPERIFLIGHSAGATHVATYAMTESLQANEGDDGLAGIVLLSGVYGGMEEDHVYFGNDANRLPLAQVEGRRVPAFVIDAELDPLRMQVSALDLIRALCERDKRCPRHQQVAGHNHYSLVYHINTEDDSIASEIVDFIRNTE